MTPPRESDHEPEDIVDMTPPDTSEDEDELEEMPPARTPAPEWGNPTPEWGNQGPDWEDTEPEDVSPRWGVPNPDWEDAESEDVWDMTPSQNWEDARWESRPAPAARVRQQAPAREVAAPQEQPKAKGSRWRFVLVALTVVVGLALASRVLGSTVTNLTGGSGGAQSATPAGTATPKSINIGGKQITTEAGALILLNPGIVRQGTSVSVSGSGFDAGSVIDLTITRPGSATTLARSAVKADKWGNFASASLNVPMSLSSGSFTVSAHQRNSDATAQAVGTVAGGAPQVKLGAQVGKPGDSTVVSLHGFAPGETVKVYWNTLNGQPVTTFQMDGGGGIGQGKLQVPFGAIGNNTFLFVGAKSQSMVASSFLVLSLYPTVKLSSYALRADSPISFSGSGFGPSERVFVFLNSTRGSPFAVINTDAHGAFKNAPGFVIPFAIKGKQTLIFMGEQSRAPNAVAFTVLPYSPIVQPSTYGGFPGTTLSFYAKGFARGEVVHVYAGHTKGSMGTMVGCFQANDRGSAAAVGSYRIPGDAQGALSFALVGAKSGGVGVASINVTAPPAPVQVPPQPPFTCPLDPPAQQTPAPSAPKGDLLQPGRQVALRPELPIADASSVRIALVAGMSPSHGPANVAAGDGIGVGLDLPPHLVWAVSGGSPISPLMFGLGVAWVLLVIALTFNLIDRSSRQEAALREDIEHENDFTDEAEELAVTTLPPGEGANPRLRRSRAAPGGGSGIGSRASPNPLPLGVRYRDGGVSPPVLRAVGQRSAGPPPHVARFTATRQGKICQSRGDTTFVQTDLKLPGGAATTSGLFLLSDGRSGDWKGSTPSRVAVEYIAAHVIEAVTEGPVLPPGLILHLFKCAVMQAGDVLLARNAADRTDVRASVTGALVVGQHAYVVNVGNCRMYLCRREGDLRRLTRDHSVVFAMVSAGLVCPEALDVSPITQQLYLSLGDADRPVRVDTLEVSIRPGDRLLLCSDGLWRQVRESQIGNILRTVDDPSLAARTLIRTASENGREHDISAIVVRIPGRDPGVALPRAT
jgi:serine/threonine protein phosphatase PrpC